MKRTKVVASVVGGVCAVAVIVIVVGGMLLKSSPGARITGQRSTPSTSLSAVRFKAVPTVGPAPLVVHFTGTSAGSPTAWSWDFGDGTTSTEQNPSHTYRIGGKYTVNLAVTTASGKHTLTKSDYVAVGAPSSPSGWTTILDDEFDTPGLPSHWLPYSGSYTGDAVSCSSPTQVQVPGDGYLHLKMEYHDTGLCGHDWYTGGMQVAKQYGGVDQSITIRWRVIPSADPTIVRSTRIIPMRWVDDPNFAWYQGEADYCEGASLSGCYMYLHYGPNYQQITHGYSVDLTQWHIFRIEQRNHQVSLYIDNLSKPVYVYKGNARTIPGASMRTVLQQSCNLTYGCPPKSYAGDVEDIQIDYITIANATTTGAASADIQSGAATAAVQRQPSADASASVGGSGATAADGGVASLPSVAVPSLPSGGWDAGGSTQQAGYGTAWSSGALALFHERLPLAIWRPSDRQTPGSSP